MINCMVGLGILPWIIFFGARVFLDKDHVFLEYMQDYLKGSIYFLGVVVSTLPKVFIPGDREEDLQDLSISESLSKGIKKPWEKQ